MEYRSVSSFIDIEELYVLKCSVLFFCPTLKVQKMEIKGGKTKKMKGGKSTPE